LLCVSFSKVPVSGTGAGIQKQRALLVSYLRGFTIPYTLFEALHSEMPLLIPVSVIINQNRYPF
jgi:hypothetical protein